jgi:hypothetical protein
VKGYVALFVLLALTMVVVTGCGVSKTKYYDAVKESSDLKAQLSEVQIDLATSQQNLAEVSADLASARSLLEANSGPSENESKLGADLAAARQSLSIMKDSVRAYELYVEVAAAYLSFAAISNSGPQNDVVAAFFNIATTVAATNDAGIKTAWSTVWDASAANQDTDTEMAAFVKVLGQRLSEMKPKIN